MPLPSGYVVRNIGGRAKDARELVIPGRWGHATTEGVPEGFFHAVVMARSPRHFGGILKRLRADIPRGFETSQVGDREGVFRLRVEDFQPVARVLALRARRRTSETQKAVLAAGRAKLARSKERDHACP